MFAGIKAIEHIYLEHFWVKNINIDIQEAQGILSRMKSETHPETHYNQNEERPPKGKS